MKDRRCLAITNLVDIPDDVSAHDRSAIERFMNYLRLVGQAKRAGVPHREACAAIYPDVYQESEKP